MKRMTMWTALGLAVVMMFVACGKDESHWGQNLDEGKKWWKKEGQSWDRDTNTFMAIGYSNPDWKDKNDQRKSADLDARAQAASFMNSLVKNYMEEVRSRNFTISESVVQATANETVLGSVIVGRHFIKKGKNGQFLSLIKVDLGYFFSQVYKGYIAQAAATPPAKKGDVDKAIKASGDSAMTALKAAEAPAIEKAIKEE